MLKILFFSNSHDSKLWKRYIIYDLKYGDLSAMQVEKQWYTVTMADMEMSLSR